MVPLGCECERSMQGCWDVGWPGWSASVSSDTRIQLYQYCKIGSAVINRAGKAELTQSRATGSQWTVGRTARASALLTAPTTPAQRSPSRCGGLALARRRGLRGTAQSRSSSAPVPHRAPHNLRGGAHDERMHHLLVALPTLPDLAKVEAWDSGRDGDLLLHLADLVDAQVREEVGKVLHLPRIFLFCMPPVVCRSFQSAKVADLDEAGDAQLAPPTGPTRWSLRIQTGVPGQVVLTWSRRWVIRFCHQVMRWCVSGISVESWRTRSCRPKNARSQTERPNC